MLYSVRAFEHLTLDRESWHMVKDKDTWLNWCLNNLRYLSSLYIERSSAHRPVNDFFGSWLNIDGKMYCGYFLGYMVIRKLEKTLSMKQIAKLSENKVESMVMDALRSF